MNIMEHFTDMIFVYAVIIGSLVAIAFVYVKKRRRQ
ncbi:EYxxD motif small membrane protein [Aureibacillus halotolerans]|uniref:Uncharacterized protein n=1 Tax=Aureibacillus halotolerans TaxID=1508390 RepID=A0A4R6TTC4_9BACI|nr:hypothetical protein EV213_12619 [Aureibacillus halotolerans]